MYPLLSICNDNYAYFDKEENKIIIGYDNKVATISVPEKMKLTALCITEDQFCCILDEKHFVRGNLRQNIERAEFRSTSSLPKGKSWKEIFYVSKRNVRKFLLTAEDTEKGFEVFYEHKDGHWLNATFDETNLVDRLPEKDYDSTVYFYTKNYIGVFDTMKESFVWQKVNLPGEKIQSLTFGKNYIYFASRDEFDENNIPIMSLYSANIKKLLANEPEAIKTLLEKTIIGSLHEFNDALVVQGFSKHIVTHNGEQLHGFEVKNLENDDYLLFMKGSKNNVLYQTAKGRFFKACFNDELSGLKSFREITKKFEMNEVVSQ